MSYILDALKKSDLERKRREPPGLQTVHKSYSAPPERGRAGPLVKWLVLVSVTFLLFVVVGTLFFPKDRPAESISGQDGLKDASASLQPANILPDIADPKRPGENVEEELASVTRAEKASIAITPDEVFSDIKSEEAEESTLPLEKKENTVKEDTALVSASSNNTNASTPPADGQLAEVAPSPAIDQEVVHLNELPLSVQESIPEVKLAGHVYAEDPSQRMIIINNRIVHEGDQVQGQLYLEEITWDGVILRYDTIRFCIDR